MNWITGARRGASGVAAPAIESLLAAWVVATALSQHPNRGFDRLRPFDRTGVLLPNWRFFAPEPAVHDYRVLHRWVDREGVTSAWHESNEIGLRHIRQAVWFPARRSQKGISDACTEMISAVHGSLDGLHTTVGYRLVRGHVEEHIRQRLSDPPDGFQFVVVADPGYDADDEPNYLFASRFERWSCDG